MKILYFLKNSSSNSSVILVFFATVQKLKLPDYVILLHASVLGVILKGLVSICFQWSSFLVSKAYLREADPWNRNKK